MQSSLLMTETTFQKLLTAWRETFKKEFSDQKYQDNSIFSAYFRRPGATCRSFLEITSTCLDTGVTKITGSALCVLTQEFQEILYQSIREQDNCVFSAYFHATCRSFQEITSICIDAGVTKITGTALFFIQTVVLCGRAKAARIPIWQWKGTAQETPERKLYGIVLPSFENQCLTILVWSCFRKASTCSVFAPSEGKPKKWLKTFLVERQLSFSMVSIRKAAQLVYIPGYWFYRGTSHYRIRYCAEIIGWRKDHFLAKGFPETVAISKTTIAKFSFTTTWAKVIMWNFFKTPHAIDPANWVSIQPTGEVNSYSHNVCTWWHNFLVWIP